MAVNLIPTADQLLYPSAIGNNNKNFPLFDDSEMKGGSHSFLDKSARNTFPLQKRDLYTVATYLDSGVIVTRVYNSTDFSDSSWTNDANWVDVHAFSFLDLTDTPDSFESGRFLAVNTAGDALEYVDLPTDITDLSTHSVTELNDITNAGSGEIITDQERTDIGLNNAYRNIGHIPTSEKGVANGVVPLDSNVRIPAEYLPSGTFRFIGSFGTAESDTGGDLPATATPGDVYICIAETFVSTQAGLTFNNGDEAIRTQAGTWTKVDNTDSVTSVFGRTGPVTAQPNDYNFNQIAGTVADNQLTSNVMLKDTANVVSADISRQVGADTFRYLHLGDFDPADYYTETDLQTSGDAQVHWDNITNVPALGATTLAALTDTPNDYQAGRLLAATSSGYEYINNDFVTGISVSDAILTLAKAGTDSTVDLSAEFVRKGFTGSQAISGPIEVANINSPTGEDLNLNETNGQDVLINGNVAYHTGNDQLLVSSGERETKLRVPETFSDNTENIDTTPGLFFSETRTSNQNLPTGSSSGAIMQMATTRSSGSDLKSQLFWNSDGTQLWFRHQFGTTTSGKRWRNWQRLATMDDLGDITFTETDPTVPNFVKELSNSTDLLNRIKEVDGTGSDLDADLLDGIQATGFVQIIGDQTINGIKTFNSALTLNDILTYSSVGNGGTGIDMRVRDILNINDLRFAGSAPTIHDLQILNFVNGSQITGLGQINGGVPFQSTNLVAGTNINIAESSGVYTINATSASADDFVDRTTNQTIAGVKTFTSQLNANGNLSVTNAVPQVQLVEDGVTGNGKFWRHVVDGRSMFFQYAAASNYNGVKEAYRITPDAEIRLYHNGLEKLRTSSFGVAVIGETQDYIDFVNSSGTRFGYIGKVSSSSDDFIINAQRANLRIEIGGTQRHIFTSSYASINGNPAGSGTLRVLQATDTLTGGVTLTATNNTNFARWFIDGSGTVNLTRDNVTRLSLTSGGVDVGGALTINGVTAGATGIEMNNTDIIEINDISMNGSSSQIDVNGGAIVNAATINGGTPYTSSNLSFGSGLSFSNGVLSSSASLPGGWTWGLSGSHLVLRYNGNVKFRFQTTGIFEAENDIEAFQSI